MKTTGKWLHLIFTLLVLATTSLKASAAAPATLPPAAQEAYDKGIMAAREQGYLVAIRYLQEARKLAPQAPQVFRSLGAVEAKIQGRELRAMAWYGAYLAAMPNALDASEVKKEIVRLEVKNQISISGLIKSVQEAANNPGLSTQNMVNVASLWAEAGDIATAIKVANQTSFTFNKDSALHNIARIQIEAGDIAGSLKTADLILSTSFKYSTLSDIALAQIKAGDIAGAQKTLASAKNGVVITQNKSPNQSAIARLQALTGDIAGAQKTTELIQDAFYKGYAWSVIAQVQAKNGDISGAQKTANLIEDASEARVGIARAQAMAGDISGAQKTVDLIKQAYFKNIAQAAIAETQKKAKPQIKPVMSAFDWLTKLDDDNKNNDCPLNTEPFLDMASYLKSLPSSNIPQKFFDSLHEAARKVVRAQIIIQLMVKNEVKK